MTSELVEEFCQIVNNHYLQILIVDTFQHFNMEANDIYTFINLETKQSRQGNLRLCKNAQITKLDSDNYFFEIKTRVLSI